METWDGSVFNFASDLELWKLTLCFITLRENGGGRGGGRKCPSVKFLFHDGL